MKTNPKENYFLILPTIQYEYMLQAEFPELIWKRCPFFVHFSWMWMNPKALVTPNDTKGENENDFAQNRLEIY